MEKNSTLALNLSFGPKMSLVICACVYFSLASFQCFIVHYYMCYVHVASQKVQWALGEQADDYSQRHRPSARD